MGVLGAPGISDPNKALPSLFHIPLGGMSGAARRVGSMDVPLSQVTALSLSPLSALGNAVTHDTHQPSKNRPDSIHPCWELPPPAWLGVEKEPLPAKWELESSGLITAGNPSLELLNY